MVASNCRLPSGFRMDCSQMPTPRAPCRYQSRTPPHHSSAPEKALLRPGTPLDSLTVRSLSNSSPVFSARALPMVLRSLSQTVRGSAYSSGLAKQSLLSAICIRASSPPALFLWFCAASGRLFRKCLFLWTGEAKLALCFDSARLLRLRFTALLTPASLATNRPRVLVSCPFKKL